MTNYKNEFYLDKAVTFLNHGSFGATPKVVMEEYQRLQIELEQQPVDFIARRSEALFAKARESAAHFLHTKAENIVFVQNTTTGLNIVANSLDLKQGDQVLTTNLEYGAAQRMWEILAERKGFKYTCSKISLPITSTEVFVNEFFKNVSDKTKVVFLSHITSATALLFPVKEIIAEAKKRQLITFIDGAHAPGHIPLNLTELDPDFYIGNFHKWVMSPKGSAFLYASQNAKKWLKPFIIGWGGIHNTAQANNLVDENQLPGTRDMSACLAVPKAIEYNLKHLTPKKRTEFKALIAFAKSKFETIFKTKAISEGKSDLQIYAHPLPQNIDGIHLKKHLWEAHKIEIPVMKINDIQYIRISVQIYVEQADIEKLVAVLTEYVGTIG